MTEFDPFDEIGEDPPESQTANCVRSWTSGEIYYELCKLTWKKGLITLIVSGRKDPQSKGLRTTDLDLSEQEIADWVACTEREATIRAEVALGE